MNNNEAYVAKIGNFQPIDGADRIIQASVILNGVVQTQVVVGKSDYNEGDLVVYFDSNLCIEQSVIDLIDKLHENYNKEGFVSLSRYLAKGNRVKTIRLRNCISDGLVVSVDKFFQFLDNSKCELLTDGYSFNDIGKTHICHKYFPPVRMQSTPGSKKDRKRRKLISRVITDMFKFHVDTSQLLRNTHVLNPNQIISLSAKFHGTSSIASYTKVLKKLKWYEKLLKKIRVNIVDTEYDYLYASRTVVKNDLLNGTGFYTVNVWQEAGEKYFKGKLHKGETVYFEIVGYLPGTDKFIQKPFDYGCSVGEYKVMVYRITLTSDDGTISEYGWDALKERCKELNVDHVIEYYHGKACDMYKDIPVDENWNINFIQRLQEQFLEMDCPYCKNKVPREGVVLRIEGLYINPYKLKSKRFILKESELKEKEDFADIEDAESREDKDFNS